MRCFTILILLSIIPVVDAENLSPIWQSTNLKGLQRVTLQSHQEQIRQAACDWQIRWNRLPVACRSAREIETICLSVELESVQLPEIEAALAIRRLSPTCRHHLEDLRALRRYQNGAKFEMTNKDEANNGQIFTHAPRVKRPNRTGG